MPFALPAKLSAPLGHTKNYWESLKRGENPIPFADDLKLTSLPGLSDGLLLIETFERPLRFRLSSVGKHVRALFGDDLEGRFVDEIDVRLPLEFLAAQASATVEGGTPTYFARKAGRGQSRHPGYARLLLPLWGNGRVEMILAVFEEV
jgi:hypothetical protein